VERLKYFHTVPGASQLSGSGQTCRATAYDGDFFPGGGWQYYLFQLVGMIHGPVGDKPLQIADGNGLTFESADALFFALGFLGTDPAADGGQGIVTTQNTRSCDKIPIRQLANEFRDRNADRATFHTGAGLALQAALCFTDRVFHGKSSVYFFKTLTTFYCVPLGHVDPLDGETFLGGKFG
jgi:hypothetical protein